MELGLDYCYLKFGLVMFYFIILIVLFFKILLLEFKRKLNRRKSVLFKFVLNKILLYVYLISFCKKDKLLYKSFNIIRI